MANNEVIVHILGDNKLSGVLSDVAGDLGNLGNVMTGLFATTELLKTGFEALSGVISSAKSAFIDYNAQMETTKIALTTLLGSAEDAEVMFRTLHRLAANTPFEFPGLADAGKRLVAMGFSAKGAQEALEASANAAAALGKGQEGIDRIGLALGQTAVKAKASAEEMMQLAEVGVNPYEILQKQLGLSADQAANLGAQNISGKQVAEAIVKGMQEQFNGSSKALSDSFTGMMATIEDDIAYILGDIGEGIFEAVKEPVTRIRDFLAEMVTSINDQGLGATLKDMFGVEIINAAVMAWELLKQVVVGVAEVIWSAVKAVFDIGASLVKLNLSLNGLRSAFGEGSSIITAFSAVLAAVRTTCDVLAEAITFVANKISNELEYAAEIANTALIGFSTTVSDTLVPAFEFATTVAEGAVEALVGFADGVSTLFEQISGITDDILSALSGFADGILTLFDKAFGGVLGLAEYFAEGLYNLIVGGTQDTADDSESILGEYIDMFCSAFSSLQDSLSTIWNSISNTILSKVQWFVDRIFEILSQLGSFASGIVSFVSDRIATVTTRFKSNFEAIKSGIADFTKVKEAPQGSVGNGSMWRKAPSGSPEAKGKGGSKGGSGKSAAQKAAEEAKKWADKIEKDWRDLDKRLAKDTESSYAQAMRTLNDEYEKYSKDIEEAQKRGIDTSRLETVLTDYYKRMREKLTKEADKAFSDVKSKSDLIRAELTKDISLKAEVQYDDSIRKITEDVEKFQKATLTDDVEHNKAVMQAVEAYKSQATLKASAERIRTEFGGLSTEMADQLKLITAEFNAGGVSMAQYVDSQISVYQDYTEKLSTLAENLKAKMTVALDNKDMESYKTWKRLLEDVNISILGIKKNLNDLGSGSVGDNLIAGIQDALNKMPTLNQQVQKFGKDMVNGLQNTFQNFFSDVLTGQVKSFGDYCKSFFNSLVNSISSIMSQLMTQWTMKAIFGKSFTGLFGMATGGYTTSIPKYAGGGNTFLVGENGPELVTLNGGGAMVTSTHTAQRQMGEASTPNVTINVVNQTGQDATAETTQPKWDGESWVIGVVLNAVSTNKNGMRSLIKGVATS